MNITASDVKDSKITATVVIPAADVDAEIKKAYKAIAKQYRFPGFRAGKAPRPVIDAAVGAGYALGQATDALVKAVEPAILNELDIVPTKAGEVKTEEPVSDHADYTLVVEYALRPSCELSSYDAVEIEMPPAEVTESEIDQQVEMFRSYTASFEDVEDRAVEGEDYVTVDMKDVKNAEDYAGEGRLIAMGTGSLPKEFDEALNGAKIGETKTVTWTPEGEDAEECSVEVTVKGIKERKLPELTDEFVKETFSFDGVDAMRDAIKLELEQDKASKLPSLKENRCCAALAERLQLEEMDADYKRFISQDLLQNFWQNLQANGLTFDAWLQNTGISSEQFFADLDRQADDVARESLALDALARELNIEVTDEDINAEFEKAGVQDVEASKASFVEDGRMPALRESIRRSKAVDHLVENAKVTEVDETAKDAE